MRLPALPGRQFQRGIFVVSGGKTRKRPPRRPLSSQDRAEQFLEQEDRRKMAEAEKRYRNKLRELKAMTETVSKYIQERQVQEEEQKRVDAIPMPRKQTLQLPLGETREVDAAEVAETPTSVLVPLVQLPPQIEARLGQSLRFLVNKHYQNWPMVLEQLRQGGGFEGVPAKAVEKFVTAIPLPHVRPLIAPLEQMYRDAGLTLPVKTMAHFVKGLATGTVVPDATVSVIDNHWLPQIRAACGQGPLLTDMYETLVIAYGKNGLLERINDVLKEMKVHGREPTAKVYSNVLTTCVYRSPDHKQAVEVFDSMRFISEATKPGTRAFQDIIVLYVNADDVEKALDLYQEMLTGEIPLNQNILAALARGCAQRPELRAKAWEFMFEIYTQGWTPTLDSFHYMIYLAARDGDLPLARALYAKLLVAGTATPRAFGFLLLAYNHADTQLPAVMALENGRNFRRNLLADLVIVNGGCLPFLPRQDLTSEVELMAELSALWAHHLMMGGFALAENAGSYLSIAARARTLEEFIERWELTTFLDTTGAQTRVHIEPEDEAELKTAMEGLRMDEQVEQDDTDEPIELEVDESVSEATKTNFAVVEPEETAKSLVRSPILDELSRLQQLAKVARNSLHYVIALKAAGAHRNYKFAQQIWTERGEFRRTPQFRNLARAARDRQDFQFATAMIQALVQMQLLDDALAVLLSTEYQFKWTWAQLVHLHRAAVEVGNDKIAHTVRQIAKRAQIKHAGKIRRRDYKMYVLNRGY